MRPGLIRFLAELPAPTRVKLVAIRLQARDRVATPNHPGGPPDRIRRGVDGEGRRRFRVEVVTGRARSLLVEGCGFRFNGDISTSRATKRCGPTLTRDSASAPRPPNSICNRLKSSAVDGERLAGRRKLARPVAGAERENRSAPNRWAFTVGEMRQLLDVATTAPSARNRRAFAQNAVRAGRRAGATVLRTTLYHLSDDGSVHAHAAQTGKPRPGRITQPVARWPGSVRATGTDGQAVLASCLALSGGQMGTLVDSGGRSVAAAVESQSLVHCSGFRCKTRPWECLHNWCWPWSSKPVAGLNKARCGFDSHALPSVVSS